MKFILVNHTEIKVILLLFSVTHMYEISQIIKILSEIKTFNQFFCFTKSIPI